MRELDRRVAIEVMGEEEPARPNDELLDEARTEQVGQGDGYFGDEYCSEKGNWVMRFRRPWAVDWEFFWAPAPFSTSLEHALRALKKKLYELGGRVTFSFDEQGWVAWAARGSRGVTGSTLPIAICNLVLPLKEKP